MSGQGRGIGNIGCGTAALIFVGVAIVWSANKNGPRNAQRGIGGTLPSSRISGATLEHCRTADREVAKVGLIRSRRTGVIVVDERQWPALSWEQKKAAMVCALAVETNGDIGGVIRAVGYRSGRELAGGSPGAGTLKPS